MTTYTATYSPEDNKLRLYSSSRLDKELYTQVRAMGFIYAPKQQLFVAPMWTPAREDFLLNLCGEIGDEDTSLVERAEDRADRFDGYQDNRMKDAVAAREQVESIAKRFEFGQPILVGHHSERRARKDAEKIQNGMRKAVSMWDAADYWKGRAAGALAHAKYKELPAVRARRIKGLEADLRKQEKNKAEAERYLKMWSMPGLTVELAKKIANFDHVHFRFTLEAYPRDLPKSQYEGSQSLWGALDDGIIDAAQAAALAIPFHQRAIAWANRWIGHYNNRLTYEKAMLQEQGGLAADKFNIVVGGQVKIDGRWLIVNRINRKAEKIVSVTVFAEFCPVRSIEEITDYKEPSAEDTKKVKAAVTLPKLTNYPGEGFVTITKAEWEGCSSDYKGTEVFPETATTGRHRVRKMSNSSLPAESRKDKKWGYTNVYVSDMKRVDPPQKTPDAPAEETEEPTLPPVELPDPRPVYQAPVQTEFDLMREQLKQGVQVVSAPQLFPTPPLLAARMADEADLSEGQTVLEPSAGTGNILRAISQATGGKVHIKAVEINYDLCEVLRARGSADDVIHRDFMECKNELGQFDRILMNPPFTNAQDVSHIQHAFTMLKPGGLLVAICMDGSKQKSALLPLVEKTGGIWEPLPAGSFSESGTQVNTVMLTLHA